MVLRGRFLGLLSGAMLAVMSGSVSALELTVDTTIDGYDFTPGDGICSDNWGRCSLRAAVMEANASTVDPVDHIYLPAGTYEISRRGQDDTGKDGDMDVFGGGSIVISGLAPREMVVVEGMWYLNNRLFDVNHDGHLTLNSLTLTGGYGYANWSVAPYPEVFKDDVHGGAVRNFGQLIMDDVVVDRNLSQGDGGGIYISKGNASISNSVISNNEGRSFGAGIFIDEKGVLKLTNTLVSNNQMIDFPGTIMGGGLAIFDARVVVDGSTFVGNRAFRDGGAIYIGLGDVTISNSTFYQNVADRHGGAIHVNGGANSSGYEWFKPVKLSNVTVANNFSGVRSGDLNNEDTGAPGGGLYVYYSAAVEVENTLFGGNAGFDCSIWGGGKLTSNGHNLDTDGSCGLTASSDLSQAGAGIDSYGDHGGSMPTISLLPDSPAVNAGSDDVCLASGLVDQRDYVRPSSGCDIGAFELEGVSGVSPVEPEVAPEDNLKPVAMEIPIRVVPGQPYHGVLNVVDPNGDELTYQIFNFGNVGSNGTGVGVMDDEFSAAVAGSYTYIADPASSDTMDMFTYVACDPFGACSTPARVLVFIQQGAKVKGEALMEIQPVGQGSSVPSTSVVVLAETDLDATTGGIDYRYPIGGLAFTVTDVPVDSSGTGRATVVIQLTPSVATIDSAAVIRKMDRAGGWHTLKDSVPVGSDPISTAVIDSVAKTITLSLVDNDIFDHDLTVGVIDDPFAYAVPVNPVAIDPEAVRPALSGELSASIDDAEEEGGLGALGWGLLLLPVFMLARRRVTLH